MITNLLIEKLGIEYTEIYKEIKDFTIRREKKDYNYHPLSGIVTLKNGDEIIVELIYKQKGG